MAAHATIPFSSSSTLQTLIRILSHPEDRQILSRLPLPPLPRHPPNARPPPTAATSRRPPR